MGGGIWSQKHLTSYSPNTREQILNYDNEFTEALLTLVLHKRNDFKYALFHCM